MTIKSANGVEVCINQRSLVLGATGVVGSRIVERLSFSEKRQFGLSRNEQKTEVINWIKGDLLNVDNIKWPVVDVIYCTASARLLADALPRLAQSSLKRVVLFTTTSISTKAESPDPQERIGISVYAQAERDVIECCRSLGVQWTVLRPTLIYDEGKDRNVTRIAGIIKKFGFFPLCGLGGGLRQPVHADDCAVAAIKAAACTKAESRIFNLPGGEILAYREMIGRIFDALKMRRMIIPLPPALWKAAVRMAGHRLEGINANMGARMAKDMIFDSAPAVADLEWKPRSFYPLFDKT